MRRASRSTSSIRTYWRKGQRAAEATFTAYARLTRRADGLRRGAPATTAARVRQDDTANRDNSSRKGCRRSGFASLLARVKPTGRSRRKSPQARTAETPILIASLIPWAPPYEVSAVLLIGRLPNGHWAPSEWLTSISFQLLGGPQPSNWNEIEV